jgi:hypothetical protein
MRSSGTPVSEDEPERGDGLERLDPRAELARFAEEPQAHDQGPSDWTKEKPSDVLLAVGLLRWLHERFMADTGR